MPEIISFKPKAEISAEENLRAFVDLCANESTAFGADLSFNENVWEVGQALGVKGKNHEQRMIFSTWESSKSSAPVFMAEPFCSFAKGYIRYQQGVRPTKSFGGRLAALRALEQALIETKLGSNIVLCRGDVLNRAANLMKGRFSADVAYRNGIQLEMIAEFLTKKGLVKSGFDWRNPLKRPLGGVRVGKEFDKRREQMLPSPAALNALPSIFRMATDSADVIVVCACAIMCSAPDRVNEVLALRADCEDTERIPSTGESAYGLTWFTSKNAPPMKKFILPSMADVVAEALLKIRRETDNARAIATWYEANPQRIYLPPDLEYMRSQDVLTMAEVALLVFEGSTGMPHQIGRQWCEQNELKLIRTNKISVRFADVQTTILAMSPPGFPIADEKSGLAYSKALFVVRRNTLHANRSCYRSVIELMEQGDLYSRMGARTDTGIDSIFDKFEFVEDDGTPIRVTSHQFRHYLNTLAQSSGLSQLDIAKWSGRADVSQNQAYDHVSGRDIIASIREKVGEQKVMFGPESGKRRRALVNRGEFDQLQLETAHSTDLGYCLHDYSMLPCQLHSDCVHCEDAACVKGESQKESNARVQREETRVLLEKAENAETEEIYGADRWVVHHRSALERLDELCSIYDDPNVPNGAIIRLQGKEEVSRIDEAMTRRLQRIAQTSPLQLEQQQRSD